MVVLNSKSKLNLKNAKKFLKTSSKLSILQEKDLEEMTHSEISPILLYEKYPIIFDKNSEEEIQIGSGNSKFCLKIKFSDLDLILKINQFDLTSEEETESIIIQIHDFKNKFRTVGQLEMFQLLEKQKLFTGGELLTKNFKIKKLINIWTDIEEAHQLFNDINKLKTIEDEIKFSKKNDFEVDFIKEIVKEYHLSMKYLKHETDYFTVRKFKAMSYSCILDDFLYLGCWKDAKNVGMLNGMNIQRILNVTNDQLKDHSKFNVKNISIFDLPTTNIEKHFSEALNFIEDSKSKSEKILVHCHAGRSRSATIVIAYLIKNHKMTLNEAVEFVKSKRKIIRPNVGFMKQLENFEKNLK